MQVKSNIVRGHNMQTKVNMAKVFDEPWSINSREWLVAGKNAQLPIITGWKVYNVLHAFHQDTFDSWKAVGGRKTDGEYYECLHDDHITNPSTTSHYCKQMLFAELIDKYIYTFENFAEINHQTKRMILHTEYLHEHKKSIVEYSLRHDRSYDAEVYDKYRQWVIYVKSTKGVTKGRAIPFRCVDIRPASHFKDWVYIFKAPDTFKTTDPCSNAWKIILHSRDKGNC